MPSEPLIRDVSDTARWMAAFRARETERADAVFRDPFARALAGDRGEQIARAMPFMEKASWAAVARTYAFDRLLTKEVEAGADMVLNLAAGLDARPYRMSLPPTLKWVEVDLPDILDYKEEVLAGAQAACAVERVRIDLSNHDARQGLFARIDRSCTRAVVLSEGLVIYLMRHEVAALAEDLARQPHFARWIVDIVSPGLLTMMTEQMGDLVRQAGAPYVFAPREGPDFFAPFGWRTIEARSMMKTAARLQRLPFWLRLMSTLPEHPTTQPDRPWSGACLLANDHAVDGNR